jgi:hypothetical protein
MPYIGGALMNQTVIHRDPEIQGGTPVFVGTRVPLKNLLDESLPWRLACLLEGHHVESVQRADWAGLKWLRHHCARRPLFWSNCNNSTSSI